MEVLTKDEIINGLSGREDFRGLKSRRKYVNWPRCTVFRKTLPP